MRGHESSGQGRRASGETKGLLWSPWSREVDRKCTEMPTQGDKHVHQEGEAVRESRLEFTHGADAG